MGKAIWGERKLDKTRQQINRALRQNDFIQRPEPNGFWKVRLSPH
jgi:hypothetical protein